MHPIVHVVKHIALTTRVVDGLVQAVGSPSARHCKWTHVVVLDVHHSGDWIASIYLVPFTMYCSHSCHVLVVRARPRRAG